MKHDDLNVYFLLNFHSIQCSFVLGEFIFKKLCLQSINDECNDPNTYTRLLSANRILYTSIYTTKT